MKIKLQKFQIGGEFASLAVNYIPTSASTTAGAYAPAIASSEGSSSKSSRNSNEKDELSIKDVLKVFDNVKGLPIDVLYVLKDFKDMFEDDTLFSFSGKPSYSSLVSYYLNNIGKFNMLALSKEHYEEARKELVANNSLDEIAIDRNGRVVVADEEGINAITLDEYKKGEYKALTNRELLNLRLTKLPFGDSIYNTMTGVGIDSVIKKVNDIVNHLGNTESNISGYSIKLSDKIKSGLGILRDNEAKAMTIDGLYKNRAITKDLSELAKYALMAVYNSLTPQEKTLVKLHSLGTPTDFISNIITSKVSSTEQIDVNLLADLNLDGSKKSEDNSTSPETNPLVLMLRMLGGTSTNLIMLTTEGPEAVSVPAKLYSSIPKADKGPMSILEMLSTSGMGGIVLGNVITFGDLPINGINLGSIMYDNTGGYMALLPCITDQLGNKVVDFSVLDEYKLAVKEVLKSQDDPEYFLELIKVLKEKGLDELLAGSNSLDLKRFQQFFVVTGYTTDKVLGGNPRFKDSKFIKESKDPGVAEVMKKALSSKDNGEFDVDPYDKWGIFEIWNGWDDIYKGSVYIPITPNLNSAYMAYGQNIKASVADQLESDYQHFQKLRSFNPNSSFVQ